MSSCQVFWCICRTSASADSNFRISVTCFSRLRLTSAARRSMIMKVAVDAYLSLPPLLFLITETGGKLGTANLYNGADREMKLEWMDDQRARTEPCCTHGKDPLCKCETLVGKLLKQVWQPHREHWQESNHGHPYWVEYVETCYHRSERETMLVILGLEGPSEDLMMEGRKTFKSKLLFRSYEDWGTCLRLAFMAKRKELNCQTNCSSTLTKKPRFESCNTITVTKKRQATSQSQNVDQTV